MIFFSDSMPTFSTIGLLLPVLQQPLRYLLDPCLQAFAIFDRTAKRLQQGVLVETSSVGV